MGRRRGVNDADADLGWREPFVSVGGRETGPFVLFGDESIVGGEQG